MTKPPIMFHPKPTFTEHTAVRPMRGHTMGAIQDGWLLYYEDRESPPSAEIDGKLCIVKTVDGVIRTRKVRRAWLPGRWDLETVSGEQMFDQYLVWAEPVILIQPYDLSDDEKRLIAEADER